MAARAHAPTGPQIRLSESTNVLLGGMSLAPKARVFAFRRNMR
jgi:hypothetical protein